MDKLAVFAVLVEIIINFNIKQVTSALPSTEETLINSTSSCFGATQPIGLSCQGNAEIALKDATVSFYTSSDNCTVENVNNVNGDRFDHCCKQVNDDCTFSYEYDIKNAVGSLGTLNEQCNGLPSKSLQIAQVPLYNQCDDSYETNAHYLHFNYYCIENEKIIESCSDSKTSISAGGMLYVQSVNFPNAVPANSGCECTIENDDCDANIEVYTIQRVLENRTGTCDYRQYIQLSSDNILVNWTCEENSVSIQSTTISSTFLQFTFGNTQPESLGTYWIGFKSSSDIGNLTINCPGESQQHCTSSTTLTTTTAAATSTTTTEPNFTVTASTTTTTESPGGDIFVFLTGLFGAIVFILLIVLIIFCYMRSRKEVEPMNDEEKQKLSHMEQTRESYAKVTVETQKKSALESVPILPRQKTPTVVPVIVAKTRATQTNDDNPPAVPPSNVPKDQKEKESQTDPPNPSTTARCQSEPTQISKEKRNTPVIVGIDRATTTTVSTPEPREKPKPKPKVRNAGITVKPTTRTTGTQFKLRTTSIAIQTIDQEGETEEANNRDDSTVSPVPDSTDDTRSDSTETVSSESTEITRSEVGNDTSRLTKKRSQKPSRHQELLNFFTLGFLEKERYEYQFNRLMKRIRTRKKRSQSMKCNTKSKGSSGNV